VDRTATSASSFEKSSRNDSRPVRETCGAAVAGLAPRWRGREDDRMEPALAVLCLAGLLVPLALGLISARQRRDARR
jgi:hypothetical protein